MFKRDKILTSQKPTLIYGSTPKTYLSVSKISRFKNRSCFVVEHPAICISFYLKIPCFVGYLEEHGIIDQYFCTISPLNALHIFTQTLKIVYM
jgi:hypothetical protein